MILFFFVHRHHLFNIHLHDQPKNDHREKVWVIANKFDLQSEKSQADDKKKSIFGKYSQIWNIRNT